MVRINQLFRALVGVGFVAALTGCQQVAINTQDSSPPSVVIKVQGADNQYHVQSSVTFQGSPISVLAIADDPDGMKAIKVAYINTTSASCTVGDTVYTGTFPLTLPPPVEVSLPGSSGQVPTELPLFTKITGPFKCSVPVAGSGIALGHIVKLRAYGTNWSSTSSVATRFTDLDIQVQA
jgi:hypothetical protein